jgi:plasmid stability protein
MRKMVVEVPDDIFRKLKLQAAEHDRTLKVITHRIFGIMPEALTR